MAEALLRRGQARLLDLDRRGRRAQRRVRVARVARVRRRLAVLRLLARSPLLRRLALRLAGTIVRRRLRRAALLLPGRGVRRGGGGAR
jgi:hypothetical protein